MQQSGSANRGGRSDLNASDSEAWAFLLLVRGHAKDERWELVHALGHSMLTVGADASCSWCIEASGVAPHHFSLHWDGGALRIADTLNAGNVRVDGAPVTAEWLLIQGHALVEFGSAAIVVETSARPSGAQQPLDPATLLSDGASRESSGSHPRMHSDVVPRPLPKATLLGVAPLTPHGAPGLATVPRELSRTQEAWAPREEAADDSSRPTHGTGDSARVRKPTLQGLQAPLATSAPASSRPTASLLHAPALHEGSGAGAYGGPGSPLPMGGGLLIDTDQRTIRGLPNASGGGFGAPASVPAPSVPPGRRETQRGLVSPPPGVVPGAVMQVRAKPVAGSAGDRQAVDSTHASSEPSTTHAHHQRTQALTQASRQAQVVGAQHSGKVADALPSRRGFPWHYVGLGLVTVVAYLAWLYLLESL